MTEINYRIRTHEYNYLVLTTQVLGQLNDQAIEKGYNRSLLRGVFQDNHKDGQLPDEELTDMLIMEGIPITCQLAMPHYHKQGKLTMPHVRANFRVPMISMADWLANDNIDMNEVEVKWTIVTIDIDGNTWENLPTIRPYAWLDIPLTDGYERDIYEKAEKEFADTSDATIEQVEEYLADAEKTFFTRMAEEE